jgi:NTE family protein
LDTVDVRAGDYLFRQGDAADGMYVVRAGQLDVLVDDLVVSRVGAGDVIGELALLTGAPRSASIRARRDSRLEHLSPAAFDRAAQAEPSVALSLARSIAARLQQLNPPQAPRTRPRVIAVVAADPGAPVRKVSASIVRGLGGYLRVVDPGVVGASGLDRAESTHDRVVLTAPYDEPEWRDFCVRSADRVVVVARASEPPAARLVGLGQDCDLVITAPTLGRAELLAWFNLVHPVSVHRLADNQDLDVGLRALSARLAQQAVGLVLAGGGARSFAQLGVLDELERAGVVIDRVAGTSAGAVIGGLFALGKSAAEVDAVIYEEFVRHNPLGDYTVPRHGLIRGDRTVTAIRRYAGDVVFEELPREFHAVSVDLIRRRQVIHSRGSLADAVAASLRIPGLFPPMRLGDAVHVDGGVLDNLPVSALERVPDGPIIAVNISMGGRSGSNGTSRNQARPPRIPGIAETLLRTMVMSSGPATAAALARADIVITPKTGSVGMLEWHQIDVLREAGRQAAIEAMPAILAVVQAGGAPQLESPPLPSPVSSRRSSRPERSSS